MGCDYYSVLYLCVTYLDGSEAMYDLITKPYYGAYDNVTYPDEEIVNKNNANEKPSWIYDKDHHDQSKPINLDPLHWCDSALYVGASHAKTMHGEIIKIRENIATIKTICFKTIWYIRV
jgi:hypothetical protein